MAFSWLRTAWSLDLRQLGSTGAAETEDGIHYLQPGGSATEITLSAGDTMIVEDAASASDITVDAGASMTVTSDGAATDTIIDNGGVQTVTDGGYADDTTVNNGGTQDLVEAQDVNEPPPNSRPLCYYVSSGQTDISDTVLSGGPVALDPNSPRMTVAPLRTS